MLSLLKRWLFPRPTNPIRRDDPPEDADYMPPHMPLDLALAVANGRMTEDHARLAVRQTLREHRQRMHEGQDNPASLWAASIVDPYTWVNDTPDFYPGWGGGSVLGVPPFLNNQLRGDVLPVYINEYGLKLIRDWSRRACQFNEWAINAVENSVSYVVGKGMQYSVLPKNRQSVSQNVGNESGAEPDSLASKAQAVLDEFCSRERWSEREQEVVSRRFRDGEAILRFFHVGRGRTAVRFVEPEMLTDTEGASNRKYGVVTAPHDIENVESYSIVSDPDTWQTEDVPAEQVLHIKANTDFDAKRGLPTLFPIRKNLERADKLLRNMSVMAQVQATFAVIRKQKQFAPSAVSAYQQAQGDVNVVVPMSGRNLQINQLFPGSIVDSSDKTEYQFPAAGVNAAGMVEVLNAELRAAAARLVFPEWMLSVDASNGNFSGQFIAEAPSTKRFEREQCHLARCFGDGEYGHHGIGGGAPVGAMWRVLAIAVSAGLLPPETLTDLEIQVEAPSLVVRDKMAETQRAVILYDKGQLSPETWAKWEGLDHEQEVQQGAKPQQQAPPPGPGGPPAPNGGGDPKSAPPGSKGGDSETPDFFSEEIKHVFGKCIDSSTHKTVPCPAGSGKVATGGKTIRTDPAHEKLNGQVREKLAGDIREMEATPEGKTTLSKGAALASKVKAGLKAGVDKALSAVDAESKGGISLMAAGHVGAGAAHLFNAVFQCVHEEVFENALSQHSIPGAHAVGMVAATVAVKAEQGLLKAIAWSWSKLTESDELFEAGGELTGGDKELLSHLARVASNAVAAIYREAGVPDVQVDADAAARAILTHLRGGKDVAEEIKVVFGRCIDTSKPAGQRVVPCPQKQGGGDKGGAAGAEPEPPQHASEAEYRAALNLAKKKFKSVPQPSEEDIAKAKEGMARLGANKYRKNLVGNSKDRGKRREALLKEFGDGQHCPCIYCGVKIGEGTLEQDKVLTTGQGGKYKLANLVPACSGCNKNRSDMGFGEAMKKLEAINSGKY